MELTFEEKQAVDEVGKAIAKEAGKTLAIPVGFAIRSVIVVFGLCYAMNFWCHYLGKPQAWQWWYGGMFILGPTLPRVAISLAALTFLASFLL